MTAQTFDTMLMCRMMFGYQGAVENYATCLRRMYDHLTEQDVKYILSDFRKAIASNNTWMLKVLRIALRFAIGGWTPSYSLRLFENRTLLRIPPFDAYNKVVKTYVNAPKWIRQCRVTGDLLAYRSSNEDLLIPYLKGRNVSKSIVERRWNFDAATTLYSIEFEDIYTNEDATDIAISFTKKVLGMKRDEILRLLRIAKDHNFHVHPLSDTAPSHLCRLIVDGAIMEINDHYDGRFLQICPTMSLKEMVVASGRNHITEANMRMEDLRQTEVTKKNSLLPCTIELPEELESLRIKTKYDLRRAGIECDHCIGNYVNSGRVFTLLFFRKGSVCASVNLRDYQVEQCYDRKNRTTHSSRKFKSFLNKEMSKLIEREIT